eukprot:SAG25_NODE_239_length_11223_cov_67.665049_9_plen_165_part_00
MSHVIGVVSGQRDGHAGEPPAATVACGSAGPGSVEEEAASQLQYAGQRIKQLARDPVDGWLPSASETGASEARTDVTPTAAAAAAALHQHQRAGSLQLVALCHSIAMGATPTFLRNLAEGCWGVPGLMAAAAGHQQQLAEQNTARGAAVATPGGRCVLFGGRFD